MICHGNGLLGLAFVRQNKITTSWPHYLPFRLHQLAETKVEKTYIIYQLPAYSSVDRSVALGKKLYFRDNGIASILAHPGEGSLFENAIFNQLREYGELAYLSKGKEFEIDFVVSKLNSQTTALEVKYHPVETDDQKLKRIAQKNKLNNSWIVGRHPTPDFEKFVWGGLIF